MADNGALEKRQSRMSRETQPDDVPATAPTLVKGITLTAVCTIAMAANVSSS